MIAGCLREKACVVVVVVKLLDLTIFDHGNRCASTRYSLACNVLYVRRDLLPRQRRLYRLVLSGPSSAGHVLNQFGAGTLDSGAGRYCARGRRSASRDGSDEVLSFSLQNQPEKTACLVHSVSAFSGCTVEIAIASLD